MFLWCTIPGRKNIEMYYIPIKKPKKTEVLFTFFTTRPIKLGLPAAGPRPKGPRMHPAATRPTSLRRGSVAHPRKTRHAFGRPGARWHTGTHRTIRVSAPVRHATRLHACSGVNSPPDLSAKAKQAQLLEERRRGRALVAYLEGPAAPRARRAAAAAAAAPASRRLPRRRG